MRTKILMNDANNYLIMQEHQFCLSFSAKKHYYVIMIMAGFLTYLFAGPLSTLFYPGYVHLFQMNLIGLEGETPSFMQLRYGSVLVFGILLYSGLALVVVGVGVGVLRARNEIIGQF